MDLSHKEKVSYGLGAIGKDMVFAMTSTYLFYYYNTVLGISATFIGVLFMVARVFDAFNDPLMGVVVEKTRTRIGKFRPWLIIGTLSNAIILFAMFSVPASLEGAPLHTYISMLYIIWGVTYTIMDIPYWSMIPAITTPGKEREEVSVIARSCAGIGYALPTTLGIVLVGILGGGEERVGFSLLALIIAILFIITIGVTALNVKERHVAIEKTPSVKEMITTLFKNDQAIVIVISIVAFNASLYLTQQLGLYFFKYDIGNAELFGLFGAIGGGSQVLAMMTLPLLRKRYSGKKILMGAIGLTIIGYGLLFILGSMNMTSAFLLCLPAIVIYIGFGLATVLTTIFLADTVDYGEWKHGQRNEGVVFSLQTFVVKFASGIAAFIVGIGLDLIGFSEMASTQLPETLIGLRVLMIVVPMVGLMIATIYFSKKYILTEEKLEMIKIKG